MKITVLGNHGPFAGPEGACSGYLVQQGDTRVLLDCGNGVLSRLQRYLRIEQLSAVVLSHLHSDHMSDMMILRYYWQIKRKRGQIDKPLKVFAPEEPAEEFKRIQAEGIFDITPLDRGLDLTLGGIGVTFEEMVHPVKCFAICLQSDGKRMVYSGDTAWGENIVRFSKEADLLLCDGGLLSKYKKTGENVPHLTAREVGIVAKQAGVKRLLLTHFWPEDDMRAYLDEAKENYPQAELAEQLTSYEV